jgi:hypothetical protein
MAMLQNAKAILNPFRMGMDVSFFSAAAVRHPSYQFRPQTEARRPSAGESSQTGSNLLFAE